MELAKQRDSFEPVDLLAGLDETDRSRLDGPSTLLICF